MLLKLGVCIFLLGCAPFGRNSVFNSFSQVEKYTDFLEPRKHSFAIKTMY
jgi:hypothetical protein